ncbi:hypothetical protein EFT87_00825 [Schleiferilactobacillus harbinensis]|uniref:hypothetical protein n=1 Tax=Schleiferilactobacillus harbinensis TaxID=304207 RepID=UPI0021A42F3B|nr:hypothetical protein [Schleiferilactobacillus harbinensis]MCT2907213.1 hypothetical protein [Schleiferilactobacillus harbinensis]
MHVGELLLLLADIRPNTAVFYNQNGEPLPITAITWTKPDVEAPAALLHVGTPGHPRRQWELVALLKEPNRPQDQILVMTKDGPIPIFGFRLVQRHIWLG